MKYDHDADTAFAAFCAQVVKANSLFGVVLDTTEHFQHGPNGRPARNILELDGLGLDGKEADNEAPNRSESMETFEFSQHLPMAMTAIIFMLANANSINGQKKSDSALEKNVRLMIDVALAGYRRGNFLWETANTVDAVSDMLNAS